MTLRRLFELKKLLFGNGLATAETCELIDELRARLHYEESCQSRGVVVSALRFKDKDHYLTNDGYPLGTECYYVVAEYDGLSQWCCGDKPQDALRKAIESLDSEGV